MLTRPHCPPDETPTLPPYLHPHNPAPTIFMLMWCPPNMCPTLLTILTLVECPPDMLPTLLTILTLAECPPDTASILTLVE
ncbi:hypothetical protein O181_054054 [Austropuccinia psidii MF-1]|uniref:Uncharacterized protein n=1 Tax=Austropuccinia psidii MF-1 TaxID=1389203 RepID=A0A9Q3E3V3_9BASI|nr:hypothetical protein [Austropuccinia psidii MF-1]